MSLRGKLAETLELPPELFGGTEVSVHAGEEVRIGGCRKILRYSETEITLLLVGMQVVVCGTRLTLAHYRNGAVTLRGLVESVRFERTRNGGTGQ